MNIKMNLKMIYQIPIVIIGIYVFLKYGYDIFTSGELFRFVITRHFFYLLQIILSAFIFIFIQTAFSHDYNKKQIFFYICLSAILVDFRFFHEFHSFLNQYNLYFDIFKTSKNGTEVASFQYGRVLLLATSSILILLSLVLVKFNFKKLLLVLFSFIFFIFFYAMHLQVGRTAYKDYEFFLKENFEIVLKNNINHNKICPKLNLNCLEIDINNLEKIEYPKPTIINRINSKYDVQEESNKIISSYLNKFIKSEEKSLLLMESSFSTDNLRAACYGFYRISPKKVFIMIDFYNLAYGLDLYLIYFFILIIIFLFFWINALKWVYKKHSFIK